MKPINEMTYDEKMDYVDECASLIKDCIKYDNSLGNFSDGYHTFNDLYHHRAVLFGLACKMYADKAWKSKKHHDNTMYDGMFIVGIDTPYGQVTYHYDVDPYWNTVFASVSELDNAPEWDGHTPQDVIERLEKLIHDLPNKKE